MERPEAKLAAIGEAVRETLALESSPMEDIRRARAGFLQQVATRNTGGADQRRGFFGRRIQIVVLAGATAVGALALWTWTQRPITFEIGLTSAPGRPGDLVSASESAPAQLRFSEGSSLVLEEGGRLRVLATNAAGARVLVENGTVDASIAPAKVGKKHWTFEAGPFQARVVGTRFKLSYRATDQTFALATQQGHVVVSGPCLKAPASVKAGAHIDLTCLAKRPPATSMAVVSPQATPPSTPSGLVPEQARTPVPSSPWRELLAAGRLREGLRAAERTDFGRVCQIATAKELLALADAARLFGRTNRAVTALRVLRQRFSRSAEATTAAFTLGRIAFEQKHAYSDAAKWFATYLREQPVGPLMGDAMGRLMEAKLRAGDQTGARTDAERYLRRFPEGPYASEARGILSK